MTDYNISPLAVCPFYRCERKQSVKCDGFLIGTSITLTFADSKEAKLHKENYCRSQKYMQCPYARVCEEAECDRFARYD